MNTIRLSVDNLTEKESKKLLLKLLVNLNLDQVVEIDKTTEIFKNPKTWNDFVFAYDKTFY